MLGIADEYIAHQEVAYHEGVAGHRKGDPEYVLRRRPDIVVVEFTNDAMGDSDFLQDVTTEKVYRVLLKFTAVGALRDLVARDDFRLHYVPWIAEVAPGRFFVFFERDETLQRMQQRVQANQYNPEFYFNLALQYRKQGLLAGAVENMDRVRNGNPGVFTFNLNIAYYYYEFGRFTLALNEFQKLMLRFPNQPQAEYGLALTLQKMGRHREAIPHWGSFLERAPNDSFAPKVREKLKEARAGVEMPNLTMRGVSVASWQNVPYQKWKRPLFC